MALMDKQLPSRVPMHVPPIVKLWRKEKSLVCPQYSKRHVLPTEIEGTVFGLIKRKGWMNGELWSLGRQKVQKEKWLLTLFQISKHVLHSSIPWIMHCVQAIIVFPPVQ
jgi:hypothetical protein